MSRFICLLLALAAFGPAAAQKDGSEGLKLTADETALVEHTNAERKKTDLKLLKPNAILMEAAREHAANMAKQDKLEHVLDEKTPADRVKAARYKYKMTGENIAWNAKGPAAAVAGWMDSEPHRENILKEGYTEIGVAVAKNAKGEPYWVQVFGTPRGDK